mmetsp:Transcript_52394/g.93523  ORF Transcript_52394/g.93523 Transcript_52394/m.93523 type:complete len:104 (-) Transcript_52394:462-773(-)
MRRVENGPGLQRGGPKTYARAPKRTPEHDRENTLLAHFSPFVVPQRLSSVWVPGTHRLSNTAQEGLKRMFRHPKWPTITLGKVMYNLRPVRAAITARSDLTRV